jgi:hypothetical protein
MPSHAQQPLTPQPPPAPKELPPEKPVAIEQLNEESFLATSPVPQAGQAVSSCLLLSLRTKTSVLHLLHLYSYIGIFASAGV